MYIDPNHWGQGIAKQLMTEILRQAKQLGHHTVISAITGNNQASIRLHEIFGFTNVGCLQEVGYKFDAWQDVIFFISLFCRGFGKSHLPASLSCQMKRSRDIITCTQSYLRSVFYI